MIERINIQVRRILFFAAGVIVYTLVPALLHDLVGSFALGWVLYEIAYKLFPDR